MQFLPDDVYRLVEESVPIACVDFVPVRTTPEGIREVGLILRDSPFGRVWCHLGGRIGRGETIAGALRRHAADTLGAEPRLAADPQPDYVYQWFPPSIRPADGIEHGVDTRKHALGLSFVVEIVGPPAPANEALAFAWFEVGKWPDPLWPGCATLLAKIVGAQTR